MISFPIPRGDLVIPHLPLPAITAIHACTSSPQTPPSMSSKVDAVSSHPSLFTNPNQTRTLLSFLIDSALTLALCCLLSGLYHTGPAPVFLPHVRQPFFPSSLLQIGRTMLLGFHHRLWSRNRAWLYSTTVMRLVRHVRSIFRPTASARIGFSFSFMTKTPSNVSTLLYRYSLPLSLFPFALSVSWSAPSFSSLFSSWGNGIAHTYSTSLTCAHALDKFPYHGLSPPPRNVLLAVLNVLSLTFGNIHTSYVMYRASFCCF